MERMAGAKSCNNKSCVMWLNLYSETPWDPLGGPPRVQRGHRAKISKIMGHIRSYQIGVCQIGGASPFRVGWWLWGHLYSGVPCPHSPLSAAAVLPYPWPLPPLSQLSDPLGTPWGPPRGSQGGSWLLGYLFSHLTQLLLVQHFAPATLSITSFWYDP